MVSVDSNFVASQQERFIERKNEKANTELGQKLQKFKLFLKDQRLLIHTSYNLKLFLKDQSLLIHTSYIFLFNINFDLHPKFCFI